MEKQRLLELAGVQLNEAADELQQVLAIIKNIEDEFRDENEEPDVEDMVERVIQDIPPLIKKAMARK